MRDFLKASGRGFASAWFWPLVLLALPNCALSHPVSAHLATGALPHSSAIMCDIERYQGPTPRCATDRDLLIGIRLAAAAEALVSGDTSTVGLDYSMAAETACGAGRPQAIDFQGQFPEGSVVCLNCGVIPTPHADATAVCVARCEDIIAHSAPPRPADRDIPAFCMAHAHLSTNFLASDCYHDACSMGGTLRTGFVDPRWAPEPVDWTDHIGTEVINGSSLRRIALATGTGDADLNAGAVSRQWIFGNDAYVEFEARENDKAHVAGLSQVPVGCLSPAVCIDSDPHFVDIDFAISLNGNGQVYLFEHGTLVTEPDVNHMAPDPAGSFGPYAIGERFRVNVTHNLDLNAVVTYSRRVCVAGNACGYEVFYTRVGAPAHYPLRVDTSFREFDARLVDVNIVYIK
jgi:hypothetical protein